MNVKNFSELTDAELKVIEQELQDELVARKKKQSELQINKVKTEAKDLLNQLAIVLKEMPTPEANYDHDWSGSQGPDLVSLKKDNQRETDQYKLSCIKFVVDALLKDFDSKDYRQEAEKFVRAYYTSFCNA